MNLSMRWLSDYVSFDDNIQGFIDKMTMSGSKVESYKKEDENIEKVVIGRVLSVDKHPDADTLYICKVDVNSGEPVQIVTGADNVLKDSLVAVALHKSKLPNGTTIKRGKLRGEVSEGMLCSLEELNLTKADFPYAIEDGIFLIEEECKPGDDAGEAIGIDDTIVEFEITSNRPDCLSVLGLAREVAATYRKPFTLPQPKVKGGGRDINDILNVKVKNKELCHRYMAAAVENVKIEPSPRWLRERLRASGVRPINNIVDITNYVMIEYGQPMHAFDLRHVEDRQIIVRNASEGEKIKTLDGEERELSSEMLVIADGKSPTAVAGVMGGEYSGIYHDTEIVIFESAMFDGPSVRRTAKKLGMRTESSGRFEKGLDFTTCEPAIKRACELVELLGAGTVSSGFIDKNYGKYKNTKIDFDPKWINDFIGVNIEKSEMEKILENLDFEVENSQVIVPSFRGDMEYPADVAEEVTRIYGYDKIPTTVLRGEAKAVVTEEQRFRKKATEIFMAQGFSEIVTYSFFSPKNYDKIRLEENSEIRESVTIRNPLGEDTSVLRTTAIPSMLMVLAHNYKNRSKAVSMFEIATTYIPNTDGQLPNEPKKIVLGQYGEKTDFFTLKGALESLLKQNKIKGAKWQSISDNPTFHPGRCGRLIIDGNDCGVLGEVHPDVAENYKIETGVYVAEIDYASVFKAANRDMLFTQLPRYPASTRDLALVADINTTVGTIEEIIRKSVGQILESLELFDVYQGKQIDKDKKSVAYALTLRASDRTLTDEECDIVVNKALKALNSAGVRIRE